MEDLKKRHQQVVEVLTLARKDLDQASDLLRMLEDAKEVGDPAIAAALSACAVKDLQSQTWISAIGVLFSCLAMSLIYLTIGRNKIHYFLTSVIASY